MESEKHNSSVDLDEKNKWSDLEKMARGSFVSGETSKTADNKNEAHKVWEARREEEAIAENMMTAREYFDSHKHKKFRIQRIQEMVERDLNSHLLTVDNLEIEVLSENPEVQKRLVFFEGVDIPIYDLKGLPFSLLSTTIDYRRLNKPGEIGTETSRKILEDPSVWTERRDEAEKASGFGTRNGDARGDTISTSYWNSERNTGSHRSGNLIYGFENVQADSIISVDNGDGGTSNMAGRMEPSLLDPDVIKQLEGADGTNVYNEVLIRRYSENGIPKKPDYIIVENGLITEESLRHAKYFGIPIVNVERSIYAEKQRKRGEELIDSISEDDTYEEIDKKVTEIRSMPEYRGRYSVLGDVGLGSSGKKEQLILEELDKYQKELREIGLRLKEELEEIRSKKEDTLKSIEWRRLHLETIRMQMTKLREKENLEAKQKVALEEFLSKEEGEDLVVIGSDTNRLKSLENLELEKKESFIRRELELKDIIKLLELDKKCFRVSRIEQLKCLDFVKEALEKATRDMESATESGSSVDRIVPGFERFEIKLWDAQNRLWYTEAGNTDKPPILDDIKKIEICFKLKGNFHDRKMVVYDGERIHEAKDAISNEKMRKEYAGNVDSSFYNVLEPVVLKYFEAIRKSRESEKA